MSAGSGSKLAVYAAITGNSVVLVAKLVAFLLTGSGAMLAETIHSMADVGNQALLAVGIRRSERAPAGEHPAGFGRDAFVWALISAVGIFFLGCGLSVAHGVESLLSHDHEVVATGIALAVLALSFVVEGFTLLVAVRAVVRDARARGMGVIRHIRTTGDPFGVAVLLEDAAAVFGVTLAAVALILTRVTGAVWWDAVGSIAIGVLLGGVAWFLIRKNRDLLIGRSVGDEQRERIHQLLADDPAVESVAIERAIITGAHSFRISAELDFDGAYLAERYLEGRDLASIRERLGTDEQLRTFLEEFGEQVCELVGDEVDRIEERLRSELPEARAIAIEPD